MYPARRYSFPRLAHAFLVLGVVALGIALRLNNIDTESVYWDEFSSLIHLKPPAGYQDSPHYPLWEQAVIRKQANSIAEFWQANRELDPATMPLYYSLEYLVWNYTGQSVPTLRLLSVFFSLLAFPLFYLLGRALWGPAAGLIALFLFAVSPVHVQFAQEIRMYSLFGLLAIASAYTFYRVVEDGGRWWAPHLLVQVLLFWTHPFAVWLPFTEGLFLIFFHWRRTRFVLIWGFAHVALLIPSALYISTIQFFGEDTTSSWMVLPGWKALLGDIFADDFIGLTAQLWGRPDAFFRYFSEKTAYDLANFREYYSKWCAVLFGGICLICVFWQARRGLSSRRHEHPDQRWKWMIFLLMWAFLPPLILIFLSNVWRPMMMPRYTMHCAFAFYLLAAGGIAALRWNILRAIPVALLVLIYAYQQGLVIDGPHRTNWNAVAKFLQDNAQPDDLILSDNWLWKRVFTYSMGPVPQPIGYATTLDTLAEQSRAWLDGAYPRDPANPRPRGLWLVINNGYFNMAPAYELEQTLALRGLMWRNTFFNGIEGIWVYEIADAPMIQRRPPENWQPQKSYATDFEDLAKLFVQHQDYANAVCMAEEALRVTPNQARLWTYIGMALKETDEDRAAIDAMKRAIAIADMDYPWNYSNIGECYYNLHDSASALPYLEKAVTVLHQDPHSVWLLSQAYLEQGQPWNVGPMMFERLPIDRWEPRHWSALELSYQRWSQSLARP